MSRLLVYRTINDLTLSLDKERAKLTLDQLAKAKREEFNNNSDATNEEKEAVIEQVNNPLEFSKAAIDASHDLSRLGFDQFLLFYYLLLSLILE
jgi:hypothetical protein